MNIEPKTSSNRFLDTSVILRGALKYSGFRKKAKKVITEPFFIVKEVQDEMNIIKKRRSLIYSKVIGRFSSVDIAIGKTPLSFKGAIMSGSTKNVNDDKHLTALYEDVLTECEITEEETMTQEQVEKFREILFDAIFYNRSSIGKICEKLNAPSALNNIVVSSPLKPKFKKLLTELINNIPGAKNQKNDIKILVKSFEYCISISQKGELVTCDYLLLNDKTKQIFNNYVKKLGICKDDIELIWDVINLSDIN